MNNGEINTNINMNQPNNTNTQPVMAQMPGVKIAPPQEGPINASNVTIASSASNQGITSSINQKEGTNTIPLNGTQPINTMNPTITSQTVQQKEQVSVMEQPKQETITINREKPPQPKKKGSLVPFLLLIIVGLGFYSYYVTKSKNETINQISYNCTPITSQKEKELNINSTLVQDLYNKVYTSIREDYANPYLNEEMKLYLAYRQITEKEKYDSNCNLFSATSMEPYTCSETASYKPKAFKEETLIREYRKLFGENTYFTLNNIQLGNTCVVGYQYIKERGEYVEGYCNKKTATSYKVNKTITRAITTGNTIVITEDVKYKANEELDLPSYLKSGTYRYTFRLDMNYNYILISKTYESKY